MTDMRADDGLHEMIRDRADADTSASRVVEAYVRKEAVLSLLEDERRILDVGCGSGVLAAYLALYGRDVTALDHNAGYITCTEATARRFNAAVTCKVGDACALEFPDASFDAVIFEEIIEHMVDPVVPLREACRVLRERGAVIVSVPSGTSVRARLFRSIGKGAMLRIEDHKQDFTVESLTAAIGAAGFSIERVTSDLITVPKLPITFLLGIRKLIAAKHVSFGHHIVVRGVKR